VVVEQSEDQPEPSDLDQVEATVQHVSLEDYEMDPDSDIEYISPQGKVIVKAEPVHEQDLKIDESPQVPWAGPSAMNPGMESTSQGMATGRPAGLSDSEAEDSDYGQDTDGFVARAIRNTDGNKAYDSDDVGIARGQPEAKKSKRSPRSEYMARIHQSSDYVVPPDDVKAPWLEPEVELEHEEDLGPLPLPLPPLPFGHVRVSCPDFFEGHKSYPAHEGALNMPPFDCTESLCVARQTWFRFGEYEDMDTQYYDTKTMGDALVDCKMLPGSTYDGSWYAKSRQIFILGKTNKVEPNVSMDWAEIRKLMAQASFFQSCKCGGRVSMDTEGFTVRALRGYAKSERLTSEEQENAFTVLHLCAPNGVMIQIRVLFDGRTVHGLEVPREIRNILKNKGIRKIGFGIEGDVKKLAAMPEPINVRSACNLHHVVLMLWPQPEAYPKQPKTGKWFVKRQLQAPCGLYSKPEDRPEHGAICIRYEEMDFVLCVDDWDDTWSWYNYLDHALAFALMDYASARAADLDHLSAQADIVRYALDILDSVRDLPYGVRNTGRGFGMVKAESDDVRDRVCCHPIVKDFDIFVRFRARLLFENSLIRKYRPDKEHFSAEEQDWLQTVMWSRVETWHLLSRLGHKDWFSMEGDNFPHACNRCGSFYHGQEVCLQVASCKFCLSEHHQVTVCPMLTNRCTECLGLGHAGHGVMSITAQGERFNVFRLLHLVASRLKNRDLACVVRPSVVTGALEVVEDEQMGR
jgi:hypothetical protein